MASITTKYGTVIKTDGLTPEQIKKVRTTAEANGAYGAKGAALADQFRKNAAKIPTGKPGAGTKTTTETIDDYLNNAFTNLKPLDLSGAPKVLTGADLESSRKGVYDSVYNQNIQGLDQKKAQDMEAQKQELAERGIPINFDANGGDLYSRSVNAVNKQYSDLDQQARYAANTQADSSLATLSGVNATASDAFLKNATASFGSQLDAITAGGSILNSLMTKYGIDKTTAEGILNRKSNEYIANLRARGSGGGAADNSPVFAGDATGFK